MSPMMNSTLIQSSDNDEKLWYTPLLFNVPPMFSKPSFLPICSTLLLGLIRCSFDNQEAVFNLVDTLRRLRMV